jgi:alpha-galactosidase
MTFYSLVDCGDLVLGFEQDDDRGGMTLVMVPSARRGLLDGSAGVPVPPGTGEPLVHIALSGETGPGDRAQGRSMLNGSTTAALRFVDQRVQESLDGVVVETDLQVDGLLTVTQRIVWTVGDRAVRAHTVVKSTSSGPLDLTMVTSFCLSRLSPFPGGAAAGNLVVHRLRSAWSAEAKLVSETLEDLHLEAAWAEKVATIERFGQVGTMPVRGFAPFVALEDVTAGVTWAAQVAWTGSWQIELCRRGDAVAIAGGLADYELGHWRKTLGPGEVFTTPTALLTAVQGGVDECSQRLVEIQRRTSHPRPRSELDVPVMFNEWCTTWGNVTHDSVAAIADRLQGTGVRYLVIDAGWYGKNWFLEHGDWVTDKDKFPLGLAATASAIRERGLIPGIWFEVETCGCDSAAFSQTDHLLKLNGAPVTAGQRRFWDLNDPFVVDYLTGRVIGLLEDSGMGYLKIDYNETLGVGCDGAGSPGEGLRRQVEGMYAFLERLRARLPELVIENCSSGGHRLEPALMAYCDVGSATDAHECPELPIVAANVLRLIPASKSLVWAAVRKEMGARELVYRLVTGFLGRLCLSGDVVELDAAQWALTQRAIGFHGRVAPLLDDGRWSRSGPRVDAYRSPTGWQAVLRPSVDGMAMLAVLHAFGGDPVESLRVPLVRDGWEVDWIFAEVGAAPLVKSDVLEWAPPGPFSAAAAWLVRSDVGED